MHKVTKSVFILLLRIIVWIVLFFIGMIISNALIVGAFVITHNEILSFVIAFPALFIGILLTTNVSEMVVHKIKDFFDN